MTLIERLQAAMHVLRHGLPEPEPTEQLDPQEPWFKRYSLGSGDRPTRAQKFAAWLKSRHDQRPPF